MDLNIEEEEDGDDGEGEKEDGDNGDGDDGEACDDDDGGDDEFFPIRRRDMAKRSRAGILYFTSSREMSYA